MTDDTTTVPDPAAPGDELEEVAFDETADLAPEEDMTPPDDGSPVVDEATADHFEDPGL